MENWTKETDKGRMIDVVYFDFQKAFHTVPHQRFLLKFRSMGVVDGLLLWITNLLTGREQCVPIGSGTAGGIHENEASLVHQSVCDLCQTAHSRLRISVAPWLQTNIKRLERVQRASTKRVSGISNLSYRDRLAFLNLPPLHYRLDRADLILAFRLLCDGLDESVAGKLFNMAPNLNLRVHSLKLVKDIPKTDSRRFFFTQRLMNLWNSLTETVISSPSLDIFKKRMDDNLNIGLF